MTFRKRRFVSHFARTHDRKASVVAAGYSPDAWARTASRLLADGEILRLLEIEEDRLSKHETASKMTVDDVIAQLGEMLTVADEAPGRRGWSAKLKILETLAKVLTNKREQAPSDAGNPKSVSNSDLHQRIRVLEAELGHGKSMEIASTALPEAPEAQPSSSDALKPPQSAITTEPTGEAKAKALVSQSPDERLSECGRHGSYLSVRVRGSWSYCPACLKEWERNEKWLASLAPAGNTRR